jgi:hypothetical protein
MTALARVEGGIRSTEGGWGEKLYRMGRRGGGGGQNGEGDGL